MKIKQKVIKELDRLSSKQLFAVLELLKSYEGETKENHGINDSYLKVREALKNCKGKMSLDIIENRADRI